MWSYEHFEVRSRLLILDNVFIFWLNCNSWHLTLIFSLLISFLIWKEHIYQILHYKLNFIFLKFRVQLNRFTKFKIILTLTVARYNSIFYSLSFTAYDNLKVFTTWSFYRGPMVEIELYEADYYLFKIWEDWCSN